MSGCASRTVPNAESSTERDVPFAGRRVADNLLSLRLEANKPVTSSLQETRLKLIVTNTSIKDVIVDNELVAGFNLKVDTDPSDGTNVSDYRTLEKPSPQEAGKRFRKLAPGDSLSRTYDLSQPVRSVAQGHCTYKNGGHVGFYYEAERKLDIQFDVTRLIVRVAYEGRVWMFSHRQFEAWFGVSEDASGMWQGRAESNTVTVAISR